MKTCPNCGELLGDAVKECFKCHYNYEEVSKRKEEESKLKDEAKKDQLSKNPLFEYKVIVINDLSNGQVDNIKIQEALDEWSEKGWRLHTIFSSEIGKNSTGVSIASFGSITNATIDQTILIFERCIKA